MGDLVLEERPAVLGPRQLSPVCCLGCCLPLRYADIVWSVNSFTCSVEIDFGFDRDQGVNNIYNRKVLSVCLSRKMITFPNGLKSSSLAVTIFVKHCNKKMFSMNCMCEQNLFGELLIF